MKSQLPRERLLRATRRPGGLDRFPFEISWGAFTPGLMEKYHAQAGAKVPPDECFDFDTRSVLAFVDAAKGMNDEQ